MAYFPMFVDLENKNCLIVGGGKVALRKVKVMKEFKANIKVIALDICDEIKSISNIQCIERNYEDSDLEDIDIVIAATNDYTQNHEIAKVCHERKIPVNAVDQIEDCSFIFPSYVHKQNLVAAISSGGKSPVMTQYLKAYMQEIMTDRLGDITEYLGSIRDEVKSLVDTENKRKKVYQKMLAISLDEENNPSHEQLIQVIDEVNNESEM